jgi:uncharacterized coiled-coil DUF342 family protein
LREIVSKSPLEQLGAHVDRLIESFDLLERENAQLKQKLEVLLQQLEELREKDLETSQEIRSLRQERLEIRSRVERIREHVSNLEKPGKGAVL